MSLLKQVWQKWRDFGRAIGGVVAAVFMTVFYFTVAIPFGIGARLFRDPLGLKGGKPRWLSRETKPQTLEEARRLY